jgi:hypothetical protein
VSSPDTTPVAQRNDVIGQKHIKEIQRVSHLRALMAASLAMEDIKSAADDEDRPGNDPLVWYITPN